ncbi:ribose-phosphate pyrophosphokinase-like domain-containing protein [Candidatus Woesearchaeota archaeon]|nr:ribose-phosphate pyrophosphokinase-like domain-containing protein [Candidatus Woesearchaeota archaeon]
MVIDDTVNRLTELDPGLTLCHNGGSVFTSGEFCPEFPDNIEGSIAYILASGIGNLTPQDLYMKAAILADGAKTYGAEKVVFIAPDLYFSRADQKKKRRSITARLVADFLKTAGVDQIITTHLHSDEVAGFYRDTFENNLEHIMINLDSKRIFAHHFYKSLQQRDYKGTGKDITLVIPDLGAEEEGLEFVELLRSYGLTDISYIICQKERAKPNDPDCISSRVYKISDNFDGTIDDKLLLGFDDIGDTLGTIINAIKAVCKKYNSCPETVLFYLTHLVLAGESTEYISRYGINIIGSNSRSDIITREGEWTNNVGLIDFTQYWYMAMIQFGEKYIPASQVLEEYKGDKIGGLYKVIREPAMVKFNAKKFTEDLDLKI